MRMTWLMLAMAGCTAANETDVDVERVTKVVVVFDELRRVDLSPLDDVTIISDVVDEQYDRPFDAILLEAGDYDAAIIISASGDNSKCALGGDMTAQGCIDAGLPPIFAVSIPLGAAGCGDPEWPVERLRNIAEATGGFYPLFAGEACLPVDLDPVIQQIADSLP